MTESRPLDDLTQLLTKKGFQDAFALALSNAQGRGASQGEERTKTPPHSLALAFLDIDSFLTINETFGHAGGDDVLVAVAQTLKSIISESGVVGRIGGDEFAVFFPGLEREESFLLLEQVRTAINQDGLRTNAGKVIDHLTISAGVAAFPVDGRTEIELRRKADQALYRAKSAGRNQVRLAYEERMVPKTAHFTKTQLERLSQLAEDHGTSEADLLRESLDDLLSKYGLNDIES